MKKTDPFLESLTNKKAEKIVVGSFMLHPERFLELRGKVDSRDFDSIKLRNLYVILLNMYMAGEPMELPIILQNAAASGIDTETVSECMDEGIGYKGHEWAIKNTRQMRERREIQRTMYEVAGKLKDMEYDPYAELLGIALRQKEDTLKVQSPTELADAQFITMEKRKKSGAHHITGLKTGYERFDFHTGGLEGDRITIVTGPTGHGKTITALNWIHHICVENKIPGLFISAEMKPQDIMDRMTAIGSGTDLTCIKQGHVTQSVHVAINAIHQSGLYIGDNTPANVHDIALLIQKYSMLHGIKVWVYDYLSLLSRDNPKMKEERDERFGRYVKILRDMSVKTNTHGIIICQVNRFDEIAESKKILNDADHVVHFSYQKAQNMHVLELRKNRHGPDNFKYLIKGNWSNMQMTEAGILKGE